MKPKSISGASVQQRSSGHTGQGHTGQGHTGHTEGTLSEIADLGRSLCPTPEIQPGSPLLPGDTSSQRGSPSHAWQSKASKEINPAASGAQRGTGGGRARPESRSEGTPRTAKFHWGTYGSAPNPGHRLVSLQTTPHPQSPMPHKPQKCTKTPKNAQPLTALLKLRNPQQSLPLFILQFVFSAPNAAPWL